MAFFGISYFSASYISLAMYSTNFEAAGWSGKKETVRLGVGPNQVPTKGVDSAFCLKFA